MSGGGGGGGGAVQAQTALNNDYQRYEEERRQKVIDNKAAIDNAFKAANRDEVYQAYGQDVQSLALNKLNENKADTDRQLKFKLARAGLLGSSADADARSDVLRKYSDQLNQARTSGDRAFQDLRRDDLRDKSNLYNLATSSSEAPNLAQLATSEFNANSRQRETDSYLQGIGNLFEGVAGGVEFQRNQQNEQERSARDEEILRSYFSNNSETTGSTQRIG